MRARGSFLVFSGLVMLFSFSGCDLSGSKAMKDLARMSINGAKAIYIEPGASASRAAEGTTNRVFKITEGGYVEEVTYFDDAGNPITLPTAPVAIYDVNSKYVMVLFGSDVNNLQNGYLVDKQTEAVYDLGSILPSPNNNYWRNGKTIQSDAQQNIFFRYRVQGTGSSVRLIDVSDPQRLTSSIFSRDTDNVESFSIDSAGNGFYTAYLAAISSYISRVQKATGGFADVSDYLPAHWTAPDGRLYYLGDDNFVRRVTVESSNAVSFTVYGSSAVSFGAGMGVCYELILADRIALLDQNGGMVEVYNASNEPRPVIMSVDFSQVAAAAYSADAYFAAGTVSSQGALVKVDPQTGACVDLVDRGLYSFYMIIVDEAGKVTFNAIRYSDGVKVIGQIDASGAGPYSVTTVDETTNAEVLVLEKIQ
jgi:hypothetical protein